jgi:hypothetical protein
MKRTKYEPKELRPTKIAWTGKEEAPRYLSIGALTLDAHTLPSDAEQRAGFATKHAGAILDSYPGYKRVVESAERAATIPATSTKATRGKRPPAEDAPVKE